MNSRWSGSARGTSAGPLGAVAAALSLMTAAPAVANTTDVSAQLERLSLEELSEVQITSVSRQPEAIKDAAASVYVITADDIRRSGALSLPEALRLAPNLNVAQIDAGAYAITARGFNSMETANKLLVLIDGRAVYTTLFAGVMWDAHGVPLGDIDRIEVISGPGGTLYGANAVNGVINVITRNAHASRGTYARVAAGERERQAVARLGGKLGQTGAFRVYAGAVQRGQTLTETGLDARDDLEGVQAGFRADWGPTASQFTLQGDVYRRSVFEDADIDGHNLTGRWTHVTAGGSTVQAQAYYDRHDRDQPGFVSSERTWDLHVQHAFSPRPNHQVVWGGGYRMIDSRFTFPPGSVAVLEPADQELHIAHVFAQDQIKLRHDLTATVGVKAEDSTYAGLEWLPSVRLGWQATERAFWWAAVSRAVRTPSRIDRELTFPGFLEGGRFESEKLVAYELGYRGRPSASTSLSVSAYHNDYDDLRTADMDPVTFFPLQLANSAYGTVRGVDAWARWDISHRWRVSAGWSLIDKDLKLKAGSLDVTDLASGGDDPDYIVKLRTQWDLTDDVELDVGLRAYDELRTVDGYVEADARLGWRVTDDIEVSIAGRNLLHDRHIESDDAGRRHQVGRSVWVALRWRG